MTQREPKLSDYKRIDEIWKSFYAEEFGLPPIDEKTLYSTIVEHKGDIVGFGQVRQTAESLMIIDQSLAKKMKIEIVRKILEKQIEGMIIKDIKECHAFAQNQRFAKMLKKHFHYMSIPGESLVLKLEKDNEANSR